MRYVQIFLTCLQEVLAERSEQVVWLLLSCINPLLMMLFWQGASSIPGWTGSAILSYYILVITGSAFLMPHPEDHVAVRDIQEGSLSVYLLKPFSYFWLKFYNAFAYRMISGICSIFILFIFFFFLPGFLHVSNSLFVLLMSFFIGINAFFLAFTFKMIIGLLAFWFIEIRGLFEVLDATLTIFAGYLMPITLFPDWLANIAYVLPFPYMIYFPVIAFEGKLSVEALLKVIGVQIVWLCIFYILYQKVWHAGIKKYSAVGQ